MKVEQIPTGQLRPNPWNPNRMNARMRRAARESVETFGFVVPLLVRPERDGYEIIDGEHRWAVARAAGYAEIPCVVRECSDAEAQKLTVALGEIEGEPDHAKLAAVLAGLSETPDFETALPYTEQELDAILALGPEALDGAGEPEEEWRTLSAQVPRSFLAVFAACEEQVGARLAEEGKALHPKRPVRRGQVLEVLAAEFLAGAVVGYVTGGNRN